MQWREWILPAMRSAGRLVADNTAGPSLPARDAPLGAEPAAADARLLGLDRLEHGDRLDRMHFAFDHGLAGNRLFDLERLLQLARSTAQERPDDLYYDAGHVEAGSRWSDMPPCDFSVSDALRRIESTDAWIILRRAQLDRDYAPLLDRCMSDILDAGGAALARRIRAREAIVIITSPRRVTAYHMDRECGFLLQISGCKEIDLYDGNDREVLPEREIELFWTRDNNAPRYRPDLQERATTYRLTPGRGVHIPVHAPHWIRNGDNVSISVNINFLPPDSERGHIYRANYHLRQLGLTPTPPFRSPIRDAVKRPLGGLSFVARNAYRQARTKLRRSP